MTYKKRRSDSDVRTDQLSIDRQWSAFNDLYESSEAAKQRRKSADAIEVEIANSQSPKKKPKTDWIDFGDLVQVKPQKQIVTALVTNDYESTPPKIEQPIDDYTSPELKTPSAESIHISPISISQLDRTNSFLVPKLDTRSGPSPVRRVEVPLEPEKIYPKGGLANRLSNLLRKQKSELAMWNHRIKIGTQLGQCQLNVSLVKRVYQDSISCIYRCKNSAMESEDAQEVLIIFRQSTAKESGLDEGKNVKIFAPFLKLVTDKFDAPVIVGPMFLLVEGM